MTSLMLEIDWSYALNAAFDRGSYEDGRCRDEAGVHGPVQ
jgi:hypothetical protein